MATRKLACTVTGKWSYCSEERFQALAKKAGSQKKLNETFVSRQGQKLLDEHGGDFEKARKAAAKATHKNLIADIVTGELLYISDDRMKHLASKGNTDEAGVRATYLGRVTKRLRKQLAAKIDDTKSFDELTKAQQKEIDREIKALHDAGKLPAPAAPKGSKQHTAPAKKAKAKGKKAPANKPNDPPKVLDQVPERTEEMAAAPA